MSVKKARFKGYILVRDKDGKPKIDDYANCPEEIKQMLTKQEREDLENVINTHNNG